MIRQKYSKRGVVLIEALYILLILSIAELLILPGYREIKLNSYNFRNEYLLNQTLAIKNSEKKEMNIIRYGLSDNIRFNHSGNVNQAKTIDIDFDTLVITLGTGKIHE